jgi:hypothetical protein
MALAREEVKCVTLTQKCIKSAMAHPAITIDIFTDFFFAGGRTIWTVSKYLPILRTYRECGYRSEFVCASVSNAATTLVACQEAKIYHLMILMRRTVLQ